MHPTRRHFLSTILAGVGSAFLPNHSLAEEAKKPGNTLTVYGDSQDRVYAAVHETPVRRVVIIYDQDCRDKTETDYQLFTKGVRENIAAYKPYKVEAVFHDSKLVVRTDASEHFGKGFINSDEERIAIGFSKKDKPTTIFVVGGCEKNPLKMWMNGKPPTMRIEGRWKTDEKDKPILGVDKEPIALAHVEMVLSRHMGVHSEKEPIHCVTLDSCNFTLNFMPNNLPLKCGHNKQGNVCREKASLDIWVPELGNKDALAPVVFSAESGVDMPKITLACYDGSDDTLAHKLKLPRALEGDAKAFYQAVEAFHIDSWQELRQRAKKRQEEERERNKDAPPRKRPVWWDDVLTMHTPGRDLGVRAASQRFGLAPSVLRGVEMQIAADAGLTLG